MKVFDMWDIDFDGGPIEVPQEFRAAVLYIFKRSLEEWSSADRRGWHCYGDKSCATAVHELCQCEWCVKDVAENVWQSTCYKYGPENYALVEISLAPVPNKRNETHVISFYYQYPDNKSVEAWGIDINNFETCSCWAN